jgi:cell division ATPase FtsA
VVSRSIQTDFSDVGQPFSSSPMTSATTKQSRREVKKASALKIKAKQSFRNLFHKSDTISTESLTNQTEPKRLSIATSGQTLAKRISKNFSKVHLPKTPTDSKSEAQTLDNFTGRKSALASLEGASLSTVSKPYIAQRVNTATVINNIVNQIPTKSANSADRLRTCELAEVCINIYFRTLMLGELTLKMHI